MLFIDDNLKEAHGQHILPKKTVYFCPLITNNYKKPEYLKMGINYGILISVLKLSLALNSTSLSCTAVDGMLSIFLSSSLPWEKVT